MSRLLPAVAALLAFCLVGSAAPAVASADDPYAPKISTTVKITFEGKPGPGKPIKVRVEVKANSDSDQPIKGSLRLRDQRLAEQVPASAGSVQTFGYSGGALVTEIAARPAGDYLLTATFTPSDDTYLGSTATREFSVAAPGTTETTNEGILPNTGGPGLWWLLLAALLVAGGAGAVVASRRRSATV